MTHGGVIGHAWRQWSASKSLIEAKACGPRMLLPMNGDAYKTALHVVQQESEALAKLVSRMPALRASLEEAVSLLLGCEGRVILCGMGKSGHVGRKIASTMVSTGTPASFLHPAEGFHGDVGIVTSRDVVIAISNSGTTREVIELVPVMRNLGAKVIALTGVADSALGRAADVTLDWGEFREADDTGLVPTVSSILTLALGDALTVALMHVRGFGAGEYRLFHPRGAIGTKLTLRVMDLLRGDHTNPTIGKNATFREALDVVTRNTLGGVSIIDERRQLVGLLTDGDVRRALHVARGDVSTLLDRPISTLMTKDPTSVGHDTLAIDALKMMEGHKPRPIFLLPVVDDAGCVVGMLHVHSLVQAGLTSDRDEKL